MKNALGQWKFLKRLVITLGGMATWPGYVLFNKTVIAGMDVLRGLPPTNVLFVSNHQTYFADVILMYHAFSASKWGRKNIKNPVYLLAPRTKVFYVAAAETMKSGWLPRILAYAGAISVERTWRRAGESVDRRLDPKDPVNISKALGEGWLVTFPQGTTKPFEKGRKGTAHIVKENRPVVVPVNIDGFRRAFDKRGLVLKKRNTRLLMKFYPPLDIDYDAPAEDILDQIMQSIKQSPEFMRVPTGNGDEEK